MRPNHTTVSGKESASFVTPGNRDEFHSRLKTTIGERRRKSGAISRTFSGHSSGESESNRFQHGKFLSFRVEKSTAGGKCHGPRLLAIYHHKTNCRGGPP